MLNSKTFQLALIKYNLWHHGFKSNELFCKQIGIANKYIDYEEILGISYKEFGLNGLIISNITLLFLLILILAGIDIGNHFLRNAFLVLALNSIGFVLCLKKFDLLNKLSIYKSIAILFLLLTYFFNFYWSISLLFLASYENILAFNKEVHYDYL